MKRREFLTGAAGSLGIAVPVIGSAQSTPCPPETIQVAGGTSATTACPPASSAGTPAWLSGRAVNEWFRIPGTALSAVPPSPVPLGITGPAAKITTWQGAALKRAGSVYLIGAAGGHGDYGGNEVNALALNVDSPRWVQLRASSANSAMLNVSPVYYDYRRSATHTYYSLQFINADNTLALAPSPGMAYSNVLPDDPSWNTRFLHQRLFCSFSLDTNDWDASIVQSTGSGRYADWPGQGDFTAALCCSDPITGDVFYARSGDNGRFWKWTRVSNTWSTLSPIYHQNYSGSAVDHTRGRILVVGDYSGTEFGPRVFRTDNGAAVSATFTGLGPDALKMSGYPGVVYDEHNDRFLIFRNTNPITVLSVSAGNWSVQILGTTGTVPASRQNGISNSVQYVPELRGVALAHTYTGDMFFLKLA